MKNLVIKSNQGNQSGFNRKWSYYASGMTLEEFQNLALELEADELNYMDVSSIEETFTEDGYIYALLTEENVEDFFNGSNRGYLPNFVAAHFNN